MDFPEWKYRSFVIALAITLLALAAGGLGGFALGVVGLGYLTYVNDRFYAPYLLDYVLPTIYACLIVVARKDLNWSGKGILAAGFPEATWWSIETVIAVYKTSTSGKWAWLIGKPW
jgi:hypothetical protein